MAYDVFTYFQHDISTYIATHSMVFLWSSWLWNFAVGFPWVREREEKGATQQNSDSDMTSDSEPESPSNDHRGSLLKLNNLENIKHKDSPFIQNAQHDASKDTSSSDDNEPIENSTATQRQANSSDGNHQHERQLQSEENSGQQVEAEAPKASMVDSLQNTDTSQEALDDDFKRILRDSDSNSESDSESESDGELGSLAKSMWLALQSRSAEGSKEAPVSVGYRNASNGNPKSEAQSGELISRSWEVVCIKNYSE